MELERVGQRAAILGLLSLVAFVMYQSHKKTTARRRLVSLVMAARQCGGSYPDED